MYNLDNKAQRQTAGIEIKNLVAGSGRIVKREGMLGIECGATEPRGSKSKDVCMLRVLPLLAVHLRPRPVSM